MLISARSVTSMNCRNLFQNMWYLIILAVKIPGTFCLTLLLNLTPLVTVTCYVCIRYLTHFLERELLSWINGRLGCLAVWLAEWRESGIWLLSCSSNRALAATLQDLLSFPYILYICFSLPQLRAMNFELTIVSYYCM